MITTTKTIYVIAAACFLMASSMSGCSSESSSSDRVSGSTEDGRLSIVCTTGMVADIVLHVAGEHADVTHIIGEGVDPHLYRATRKDVQRLQDADVIFYSGLHLEGKMGEVLEKIRRPGKKVFAVTGLLDESYLLGFEGHADHHDPHVWMDVSGWEQGVAAVGEVLSQVDPAHASAYSDNASLYRIELASLHAWSRDAVASIPETGRVLITAHDAFNYFGRAYGLEVLGIQGISTESEAGLDDINRLIDLIVAREVKAVFVESSVAPKNVQALVEGAQSRGVDLRIGGELFSDAMGAPGTREGTYIGMIEHNVMTIVTALGGTLPEHATLGKPESSSSGSSELKESDG